MHDFGRYHPAYCISVKNIDTSYFFHSLFTDCEQPAVFIMNTKGKIMESSKGILRLLGYAPDEVKGKYYDFLFTEDDRKQDKPQHELEKVLSTGRFNSTEDMVCKNGSLKTVSSETVLAKGDEGKSVAIVKTIIDQTAQVQLMHLLEDSTDFTENVFDTIKQSLIILNEKEEVIQANRFFYQKFKIAADDIKGKAFCNMGKGLWDLPELKRLLRAIYTKEEPVENFEVMHDFPHIGKKALLFHARRIELKATDTKRVLVVIEDVTETRATEASKDEFIGFATHELRTPITGLRAYMQLLERSLKGHAGKETEKYINKSFNFIDKLNNLIYELHDITKAQGSKLQINPTWFNFEKFISDIIDTQRHIQNTHEITKKGEANIMVFADEFRLAQVLTNFLSNAIKYSPKANKVEVSIKHEKDIITVGVKDHGVGIPRNKLGKVFNKFFREDKTKKIEGLGLGLFLAKEIIKKHGGKVWVESEEGKGSVFYFSLPVAANERE